MKRVAKPANIKAMLMSRGDAGKKRKKEVCAVAAWLHETLELDVFVCSVGECLPER